VVASIELLVDPGVYHCAPAFFVHYEVVQAPPLVRLLVVLLGREKSELLLLGVQLPERVNVSPLQQLRKRLPFLRSKTSQFMPAFRIEYVDFLVGDVEVAGDNESLAFVGPQFV